VGSLVSIVTRLRAERRGSISGGGRDLSSPPRPDRLWGPPSDQSSGYQELFPRVVTRKRRDADH